MDDILETLLMNITYQGHSVNATAVGNEEVRYDDYTADVSCTRSGLDRIGEDKGLSETNEELSL